MRKTFEQIKNSFVAQAKVTGPKTYNPVAVAMVGITGAGNSWMVRALKKKLGGYVIEKNKIRVALREKGPGFNPQRTDEIAYAMLGKILKARGSAILDSDFVEKGKRKRLERLAKRFGARVLYLHVTCNRDVMFERMLRAGYNPNTDIFKSSAVAVREHCRRYPWHYRWSEREGGQWLPRRLGIKFFAEINTTDPASWKKKIKGLVKRLRAL